jgi:hypothetical protein
MKHTVPNRKYNVQSVFNSTSTQVYQTYLVEGRSRWITEGDTT